MVNTLTGFTTWFSAQPTTIAYQNRRVISIDIPVTLKSGVNGKAFDLKQWITLRNGVWALTAGASCSRERRARSGAAPYSRAATHR
jgi:hypothetical protein